MAEIGWLNAVVAALLVPFGVLVIFSTHPNTLVGTTEATGKTFLWLVAVAVVYLCTERFRGWLAAQLMDEVGNS